MGLIYTSFAQNSASSAGPDPVIKVVKFYPNPATTVVNFEFQSRYKKNLLFQIYNFVGKKVAEIKSPTPKFAVALQDYYRGVYIFQIRDQNGQIIESGKFQVVK